MFKVFGFLFKTAIIAAMATIFIGLALYGYARYIEPFLLSEKQVQIHADSLTPPEGGESLNVALFGDTHFGEYYSLDNFEEVIEIVNNQSPDLIIFTGDLIDNFETYNGDTSLVSQALSRLEAPLGKFAVSGNHDYDKGAEKHYEAIMSEGGFTVLKNEFHLLPQYNAVLAGIDDCAVGYGDPTVLTNLSDSTYNIVLCHEPDIADQLSDYNFDLMLSGHTHGGQVNIPKYTEYVLPVYGQKYVRGLFRVPAAQHPAELFVTTGIGMTKLPFRFMARPEIVFLTLTAE